MVDEMLGDNTITPGGVLGDNETDHGRSGYWVPHAPGGNKDP